MTNFGPGKNSHNIRFLLYSQSTLYRPRPYRSLPSFHPCQRALWQPLEEGHWFQVEVWGCSSSQIYHWPPMTLVRAPLPVESRPTEAGNTRLESTQAGKSDEQTNKHISKFKTRKSSFSSRDVGRIHSRRSNTVGGKIHFYRFYRFYPEMTMLH